MKINRKAKSQQKQNREYWRKRIAVVQDNLFDKAEAEISARVAEHYKKALETIRADMTDILMKVASGDYNMNELYKFNRYAKLQGKINEALKSLGESEIDIMGQHFKEFYKTCDSSILDALGGDSMVGTSFSVLDNKAVVNAVNQIWCADGQGWSSRIWKNKALLQSKLERGLVDCIARGGKSDDLKKTLRETFDASFGESARLVRTELAQLQNAAAVARYKEAGVEEVKTIACKDNRTCKICRKKDGKKHPIDKALPGIAYLFHPNCRCQVVPVLDVPDWTAEDRERLAQAEVDRLEGKEQYRKGRTHRKKTEDGKEIISKALYDKLTHDFVKNDGIIIRGKDAEKHLGQGKSASYLPSLNTAFIKDEPTVSDVLEEMHHAEQDRKHRFGDMVTEEVLLRREIETQKYLISVEEKYKIPLEEREVTRENLKQYEKDLAELLERRERG